MSTPVIIGATGTETKCLKKNLEAIPTKHSIQTTDSCTRNITHDTESTAVWNLKLELWGSPLLREKRHVTRDKVAVTAVIVIIIIINK